MYTALKNVKFDKLYYRGDIIPDDVVNPEMEQKLINCGLIQKTADPAPEPPEPPNNEPEADDISLSSPGNDESDNGEINYSDASEANKEINCPEIFEANEEMSCPEVPEINEEVEEAKKTTSKGGRKSSKKG